MQTHSTQKLLLETMVVLGGGKFAGVQASFRDKHGKLVEPLVLFNSPATGSTLAIPQSKLSASAVRAKIAESNAMFERFAEDACTRVLRQFAPQAKPIVRSVAVAA